MLTEYIEEEGINIIIEGLVVQKELCQKAEVLAVEFVFLAIYFEDRNRWIRDSSTHKIWVVCWRWWRSVDLIACVDKTPKVKEAHRELVSTLF